jgi:hypothetical protein
LNIDGLVKSLTIWFGAQNLEVQQLSAAGDATVLQCRERESWKTYVGMTTALNVELRQSGPRLDITLGAGKWADKALIGAAGFAIPLLFVPAAFGAWKQKKLPERTFAFIEEYVVTQHHSADTRTSSSRNSPGHLGASRTVSQRGHNRNQAIPGDGIGGSSILGANNNPEECLPSDFALKSASNLHRPTGPQAAQSLHSQQERKSLDQTPKESREPEVRRCDRCGKPNSSTLAICHACGADLGRVAKPTPSAVPLNCPCGQLNTSGRLFCVNCGKPLICVNDKT